MILPETDHWKHQYLIDLLDENALSLITSLTDSSKRLPTIRDYVQLPDAPQLGPELLAGLHSYALDRHSDPEWVNAHRAACQYYSARAESLFDRGQTVLARAGVFSDHSPESGSTETSYVDPELVEWDVVAGLVAELMDIWEKSGRSPSASTQLLLLTRAVPERLRFFATGITFAVLEFHTAGHNLAAMRPDERSDSLELGANSAIRLARLVPDRGEEFITRALVLGFQALDASNPGVRQAVNTIQFVAAQASELLPDDDSRHAALKILAAIPGESAFNEFDFSPPAELVAQFELPNPSQMDTAAHRHTYRLGQKAATFPDTLSRPDESSRSDESRYEFRNPLDDVWRLDFMLKMKFDAGYSTLPGRDYDPDSLRSQSLVAISRAVKREEMRLDLPALDYLLRISGPRQPDLRTAKALLRRSEHWVQALRPEQPSDQIMSEVIDLLVEATERRTPSWLTEILLDRGETVLGLALHVEVAKREVLMDSEHPAQPYFHFTHVKSLDRLAAIANSVDPFLTEPQPPEAQSQVNIARACLLELLEYPDLAAGALSRIPLHRLTDADRERMGEILSARLEVFAGDPVTDPEYWATEAVELTLLRAIDYAEGAPWMYGGLAEEEEEEDGE